MSGRSRNQAQGGQSSSARQNEYFVPRDGIDREVITADICRYLGNDALVRPGNYTDDASGRSIQGYFITAYRNLTTAMIADLKNDSARWDQERRRHQAGTVRYQDSAIHRGSGGSQYSSNPHSSGSAAYPRDPVMETQKFSQDATGYSSAQSGTSAAYTTAYPGQSGYSSYQAAQQPSYSSPTTDLRYTTGIAGSAPMPAGYTTSGMQPVEWSSGADYRAQGGYDTAMTDATMQPPRSSAAAAYPRGGVQSYIPTTQAAGYSSYQQPTGATAFAQPMDSLYGRGGYPPATSTTPFSDSIASPAGNKTGTSYSPVPEPQYDDPMAATSRPIGGAAPQPMPTGTSSSRRERSDRDRYAEPHRDRDRDRSDRDRHPDRDEKPSRKGYGGGYNRH